MKLVQIKGSAKPMEVCASMGMNDKYGGIELVHYTKIFLGLFEKYPYDMMIWETKQEGSKLFMSIRLSGYSLYDHKSPSHFDVQVDDLNEKLVIFKQESLPTETFWVKVDDYGDKYVATFLFPSEY